MVPAWGSGISAAGGPEEQVRHVSAREAGVARQCGGSPSSPLLPLATWELTFAPLSAAEDKAKWGGTLCGDGIH